MNQSALIAVMKEPAIFNIIYTARALSIDKYEERDTEIDQFLALPGKLFLFELSFLSMET